MLDEALHDYAPRIRGPYNSERMGEFMRRFGETESNYIKGGDLRNEQGVLAEPVVTISAVTLELVGQEKDEKFIIYFRGKEKGMVLNATNENFLAESFGAPEPPTAEGATAQFGGQRVQIYYDPDIMFGKKKVGGLRLRSAPAAAAARRAPAPPPPPPVEDAMPPDDDEIPF